MKYRSLLLIAAMLCWTLGVDARLAQTLPPLVAAGPGRLGQTGRGELELSAWGGEAALGEGREAFRQPDSHEALGVETLERRPVRLRPRSAHRQLDQLAI